MKSSSIQARFRKDANRCPTATKRTSNRKATERRQFNALHRRHGRKVGVKFLGSLDEVLRFGGWPAGSAEESEQEKKRFPYPLICRESKGEKKNLRMADDTNPRARATGTLAEIFLEATASAGKEGRGGKVRRRRAVVPPRRDDLPPRHHGVGEPAPLRRAHGLLAVRAVAAGRLRHGPPHQPAGQRTCRPAHGPRAVGGQRARREREELAFYERRGLGAGSVLQSAGKGYLPPHQTDARRIPRQGPRPAQGHGEPGSGNLNTEMPPRKQFLGTSGLAVMFQRKMRKRLGTTAWSASLGCTRTPTNT